MTAHSTGDAFTVTRHRFVAALIIAAFVLALPASRERRSVVYDLELVAFGLAHYCLSLYYARAQARTLIQRRASWLPLLVVALGCAPFVLLGIHSGNMNTPLLVYFGIHHVFNETHMSLLGHGNPRPVAANPLLRGSTMCFHACAYAALVVHERSWLEAVKAPILCALILSAGAYAVAALRSLDGPPSTSAVLRVTSFEAATFAFALAVGVFDLPVRWTDVVLFHFVYWLLHPTLKLRAQGPAVVRRYVVQNAVLVIGFGVLLAGLPRSVAADLFNFGSFLHIASSFALSRAQPAWITRWFWPTSGAWRAVAP